MIALDTTFLLDYLDGEERTRAFLEERRDRPFFAPTHALFEAYRGGARAAGSDGPGRVANDLDWVEPLPLTNPAALEAAQIEAELLDAGAPINVADVLIAGVCRHNGATLVTRDEDFDAVPDLDVLEY